MSTALLVGSSIFQQWVDAGVLLPDWRVVNRAIGGTGTSDWTDQLADVVAVECPDAVLFYCGSNDLNRGTPANEILANVLQCREIVQRASPSIRFAYFGIIKAPEKEGKWDTIDDLNAAIRQQLRPDDLYIETNAAFVIGTEPDGTLFVEDGLHLTADAYTRLSVYAAPAIRHWLAT